MSVRPLRRRTVDLVSEHDVLPVGDRRHRVVVVGAGFGGLAVAKGLRSAPVDVDVVDANNFHLFQPLLYQVATAGLDADDVAYAVRGIFRRQRNVTVHMAEVVGVDLDARVLSLDRGDGAVDALPYDSLVVAAGAVSTRSASTVSTSTPSPSRSSTTPSTCASPCWSASSGPPPTRR